MPSSLLTLLPENKGLIPGRPFNPLVPFQYIDLYKLDAGQGGNYTMEIAVFNDDTEFDLTPDMVTLSGVQVGGSPEVYLVDSNVSTIGFWTDTSGIGTRVIFDMGSPQYINNIRIYTQANVHSLWLIRYSHDGVTWTDLILTSVDPASAYDAGNNAIDVNDTIAQWYRGNWDPAQIVAP